MKSTEARRVSRVLIAYFDHQMASRLWRKISKEYDDSMWKLIAEEVFALIPIILKGESFYSKLYSKVALVAEQHLATTAFAQRLQVAMADAETRYLTEFSKELFRQRLQAFVNNQVRVDQNALKAQYQMILGQALMEKAKE